MQALPQEQHNSLPNIVAPTAVYFVAEVFASELMHLAKSHKGQQATTDCSFCMQDLADACEEGDVDKFTNTVAEFDNMTRLDGWKTTLLLRVKKRIPEEDFT